MSCILCFIEDDFQESLRRLSQSKSERFEDVISDFQNNFLNELEFLNPIDECNYHKGLHTNTKGIATRFKSEIDNLNDITEFCNNIRSIYLQWIKGKTIASANALKSLLDSKLLMKSTDKVNKSIFFRGRKSSSILTVDELFHIPFNKRHLIGNQRYSITGQPLLYLGLSPIDVVYELRQSIKQLENIYFCSFVHATDEQHWVLDITNPYPDFFSNYEILSNEDIPLTQFNDQLDTESDFYKFILTQFCSFRRSRWTETGVFAEEYVLPQLLSEVLRENSFSGILFSSTRVDSKVCYSKAKFHVNRHRENLALFTSYNDTENIDRDLFNQFIASKPITIDDKIDLTLGNLSNLRKQIGKLIQKGARPPFPINIAEITGTSTQTRFEELYIKEDNIEKKYFDHDIGRLHLQLVYQMVMELRNQMNNRL
jgi:hypothetical protein